MSHTKLGGVGIAMAATAALIFGITSIGLSASAEPAQPIDVLQVLTTPVGIEDAVPAEIELSALSESPINKESVRFVGATDDASFWVAVNDRDEVCFVSWLPAAEVAAAACAPASVVEQRGILLGLAGDESRGDPSVVGVLLPDSVRPVGDEVWREVGENLIVADAADAEDHRVTLDRDPGEQGGPVEIEQP